MPLRLTFAACSDIGHHRSSNQDRWCVRDDLQLAAVADGMGGLPHGETAAQTAIDELAAHLLHDLPAEPADWRTLLDSINREVAVVGRQISPKSGIGTTLTIARLQGQRLQFAHVGDSALFRLRSGQLEQLTCEHTVASEILALRAAGVWQPMPAAAAHALTCCLGLPHLPDAQVGETELQPGDRLLLCTDGLTKPVQSPAIRDTLARNESQSAVAQALVELANREGGPDNITAVVGFATED